MLVLSLLLGRTANSAKISCKGCKKFIESFNKGLLDTENSSYAGGDTSWEEENLGSYANSEVRLVEVLESVCSAKNYECHSILEKSEEDIEKWWLQLRHADSNADLLQWLCFGHLEVCCVENTFGASCEACPGGVDSPCGGHGNCEGAEEKNGSGQCKCDAGYRGDACGSCDKGYYEEGAECKACDRACLDDCSGAGPDHCTECASGYQGNEDGICKDVDECRAEGGDELCSSGKYCLNTPGSYKCNDCDKSCAEGCGGAGPVRCVECASGYLRSDAGVCKDVDECSEEGEKKCSDATYCENTPGSYICKACHVSCRLVCRGPAAEGCEECKDGYSRASDDGPCTDIDECATEGSSPCDLSTEQCHNLVGTFVCKCQTGLVKEGGKCVPKNEQEKESIKGKKTAQKKKKKRAKKGAKPSPLATEQPVPAVAEGSHDEL